MRSVVLIFIGLAWSTLLQAQQWSFQVWHEGKIVLENGDTLKGFVKYDIQQDLVQFNIKDKVVEAYTPRKVLFFEIFDAAVHKYRQFYSLPYSLAGAYNTSVFFELLVDGKMTLLAREALEVVTYNSPYYVGGYSRQVLVTKFFIMTDKGEITPFRGDKKDLLKLMGKKAEEIQKYMRANRLDYNDKYDFARIVEYYNSLGGS